MLGSKNLKGFLGKKAIFPEGTEKLETHEECNQCKEPLFFAFRKSDHHPVLACVMCDRLYLSKATTELLTRAKNELTMNEDEKRSLFSFQFEKNSNENSQTTEKKVELQMNNIRETRLKIIKWSMIIIDLIIYIFIIIILAIIVIERIY